MGCKGSRVRIPPPRPVIPRVSSREAETLFLFPGENQKLPHTLPHTKPNAGRAVFCCAEGEAEEASEGVDGLDSLDASDDQIHD